MIRDICELFDGMVPSWMYWLAMQSKGLFYSNVPRKVDIGIDCCNHQNRNYSNCLLGEDFDRFLVQRGGETWYVTHISIHHSIIHSLILLYRIPSSFFKCLLSFFRDP